MKPFTLIFLLISNIALSQSYYYSFGVSGNLFKGDIQQWNYRPSVGQLLSMRPSIHAEIGFQQSKAFDYRFRLSAGTMYGNPDLNPLPNVSTSVGSFSTPLVELAFLLDYNFFDFLPPGQTKFNWSPYLVGGLAGFYANPNGNGAVKSMAIPYGMGLKWKLNKKIMLRFETVARKTFTDRLDLEGGTSNFTLNRTDQYLNTSISIVYSIFPIICPRID